MTLRACRYPHRMRVWKQLPREQFVSLQEPGVCVGAPPKEIRLAETADGAQGRTPGAGGPHHRLPRDTAGSQEGSLAPAVHDEHGRTRRRVADLPPGNITSKAIGWRSMTCCWMRCRVVMTRRVPTGSGHEPGRFSTQPRHLADRKICGIERGSAWLLNKVRCLEAGAEHRVVVRAAWPAPFGSQVQQGQTTYSSDSSCGAMG